MCHDNHVTSATSNTHSTHLTTQPGLEMWITNKHYLNVIVCTVDALNKAVETVLCGKSVMADRLASMCLHLLSHDSLTYNCRVQSLEAAGQAFKIRIYQGFVVLLCPVMLLFSSTLINLPTLLHWKYVEKSHKYKFCVATVTYMAAA